MALGRPGRDVPAMTVGPLREERDPVMLWVHTGTATVDADGETHHLRACQAIWVPPGVEHTIRTVEGTVVFPFVLLLNDLPRSLADVHVVVVPPHWERWLIHQWDDNSCTRETVPDRADLLRLLGAAPSNDTGRIGTLLVPRSRAALGVARTLLRHPECVRGLEWFAERESVSAKTLQRQFRLETGVAFGAWRTQARMSVAARLLAEGRDIGGVARAVGFQTPSGFTKAFGRHAGMAPRDFVRRRSATGRGAHATSNSPRGADDDSPQLSTAAAPPVPARTFWEKVNAHHELMWVYRGRATIRIGARVWPMGRGQAIWVPAGLGHTLEFDAESLVLTVGTTSMRGALGIDDLQPFWFPPTWDGFLLHTMISEFTLLRPASGPTRFVETLLREHARALRPHPARVARALGDIARALHRRPADPRSLADWAAHLHCAPDVLASWFADQAGTTFPRWRARIRMDVARDLLRTGVPPGQIHRRLGYADPATFARAFTIAHGLPPRTYQRRETR